VKREHAVAVGVVVRAGACGAHEALVGDLLEEVAAGRSALWVSCQLAGWGASLSCCSRACSRQPVRARDGAHRRIADAGHRMIGRRAAT
jgi:hypothetical protein